MAKKKAKVGNLTVFLNLYKKPHGSDPEYRGFVTVDGVGEYELALWINNEVGGVPVHLSGQLTVKEPRP